MVNGRHLHSNAPNSTFRSEGNMTTTTTFLCRLLGIYCLIVELSMALHRDMYVGAVTALMHDAPLMLIVGIFTTLAGLALVLVHNRWRANHYVFIVTVLAWATLLKGLLFLFVGPSAAPNFYLGTLRYAQLFYGYAAFCGLLGVYLCIGGFGDTTASRSTKAASLRSSL